MHLFAEKMLMGVLIILYQALRIYCSSECDFRNYLSSCHYSINNQYPVRITGVINRCNNPVDVTLDVQSTTTGVDWSHTFVNQHEIQMIHGFPQEIKIHVSLTKIDHDKLQIKAEFHVESTPGPFFINSNVSISSSYSCSPMSSGAGTATLAVFVVILIALVTIVPLIVWWRRRQHRLMTSTLVENMEQYSPDRVFHDKDSVEMRPKSGAVPKDDDKKYRKQRAADIKGRLKSRLPDVAASAQQQQQKQPKSSNKKKKQRDFPHVTVTRSEEVTVDVNALRELEIC